MEDTTLAVRVLFHEEAEGWWAESADVAGWTAVGATLDQLRSVVGESLAEVRGAPVEVVESVVTAETPTDRSN